jgi:hypothetical protein
MTTDDTRPLSAADAVMALDPDWCESHECATIHRDDALLILAAERARYAALVAVCEAIIADPQAHIREKRILRAALEDKP